MIDSMIHSRKRATVGAFNWTGFVLAAIGLLCFLSGCAMEINTSARSGAAAGLAVHGLKFTTSPKAYANATKFLTREGIFFYKLDARIPRDNHYFLVDQFMSNCMTRCEQGNEPDYDPKFCHSYCACTAEEFRNNIPMQNLMAFGLSNKNASQPKINQYIGTCAREAHERKQQVAPHELAPGGNPQSNTNSANTSR